MKKALFLDIDGVLQPCGQQKRFEHLKEMPDICARLNQTLDCDFDFEAYTKDSYSDTCDVAAVYFDWDKQSVENLRRILDETGARIVISSDWREWGGLDRMKGFLAIHGLDKYLDDTTYYIPERNTYTRIEYGSEEYIAKQEKEKAWKEIRNKIYDRLRELYPSDSKEWGAPFVDSRTAEIREYLDRHPEITSFVALDDRNLTLGLDGHFIRTDNRISDENVKQAIEILQREDGPFLLDDTLHTPELEAWREKYGCHLHESDSPTA